MENFKLETAGLDKAELLLEHRMNMWREIYTIIEDNDRKLLEATRKWITEKIENGSMLGIVAKTPDGRIAGSGCILIEEDEPRPSSLSTRKPYLLSMYTEKAYRGKGVATAITKFCINWTIERGFDKLTLRASKAGRPIYEKLGFKQTNEMQILL